MRYATKIATRQEEGEGLPAVASPSGPQETPEVPAGLLLRTATVDLCEGEHVFCALVPGRSALARRAAGCLVRPREGDRVLLAEDGSGGAWILQILERERGALALETEGDLEIRSLKGSLSLGAPLLSLRGRKGEARFLELSLHSREAEVNVNRLRSVFERVESFVGRLNERVRDAFRWVEGVQELRARNLIQRVQDRFLLRSRRSSLLSDKEVKVDAPRITLG